MANSVSRLRAFIGNYAFSRHWKSPNSKLRRRNYDILAIKGKAEGISNAERRGGDVVSSWICCLLAGRCSRSWLNTYRGGAENGG